MSSKAGIDTFGGWRCKLRSRAGNGGLTNWSTTSGTVGLSKYLVQFEVYRLVVGVV